MGGGGAHCEVSHDALHLLQILARLLHAVLLTEEILNHSKSMKKTFDWKEECEPFALEATEQTHCFYCLHHHDAHFVEKLALH